MRRFPGVASVVFACAIGCGKTTSLSDASHIDSASTDANTTVDAVPMGDVTVTTHSRCCTEPAGTLDANIPVFSIQPDGTAGPTGTTDATGKVTLSGVQAGASITAVYPTGTTSFQLVTVLAVKPGDNIVLGDEYTNGLPSGTGTMTVTYPTVPGATNYTVYSPCSLDSAGGAGLSVTVNLNCTTPTANLLVVALDDSGNVIAAGVLHGVTFTNGQTVALAAWTTSSATNFTESISGLIPEVNYVYMLSEAVVDGTTRLQQSNSMAPASGAASLMFDVPGVGDRTFASAQLSRNGQVGRQVTYRNGPGDATTATFPAPTLPWLGQVIINSAAQSAAWLQVGKGSYDAAVLYANWNHLDVAQDTTIFYDWTVVVPPGVTQLDWSNPPAALAGYYPADTDSVGVNLQLIDLANTASYDELRAVPEWQWTCPDCVLENGEVTGVSSVSFDGSEGFQLAGTHRPSPANPHPHARR